MKPFNLDEYLKNPSRRVVTRDGREVKILCTNYYLSNQCVIAEVVDISRSFSFNQYGVQYGTTGDSPLNLFFASDKHEGWVNIYRDTILSEIPFYKYIYPTEEEAKRNACFDVIATAKIEWEE